MNVDLIYFGKLVLGENNKFTLNFSDEEFIQKNKFKKKKWLLYGEFRLQFDFKRRY